MSSFHCLRSLRSFCRSIIFSAVARSTPYFAALATVSLALWSRLLGVSPSHSSVRAFMVNGSKIDAGVRGADFHSNGRGSSGVGTSIVAD